MERRHGLLALGLLALGLLGLVEAAEWSKLKKCSDSGFCRRNRAPTDASYVARGGQLDLESGAVRFSLHRVGSDAPPLSVTVSRYTGGVFRIIIDDEVARFPRYRVSGALDETTSLPALQKITAAQISANPHVVEIFDDQPDRSLKLVIPLDPAEFTPKLVQHDKTTILLNENGWMRFERQDEKPQESRTSTDSGADDSSESSDSSDEQEGGGVQAAADEETGDLANEDNEYSEQTSDEHTYSEYESYETSQEENDHLSENEVETNTDGEDETAPQTPECDGCFEESFKSFRDPKVRGPESVGMQITFPGASSVYGIPERTTSFALPSTLHSSMGDRNYSTEPHRMFNLDVYEFELDSPFGIYGSVPFMMARNPASAETDKKPIPGVFWHNAAETYVDIAHNPDSVATHWYSEAGVMDLFLLPGGKSPSNVFGQYRMLTGPPAMPSRFALGYHQCRWNYRDDADTRAVDLAFDTHSIPYDVIWLDIEHTDGKRYFTWDLEKFPDPEKLQNDIAARGRKVVTIIDPHIKRDDDYTIHQQARDAGHYVKKADGVTDYEGWCWPGSSSYYDFLNPEVRSAWAAKFTSEHYPYMTKHLHVWNDMNEPSVFNGPEQSMERDLKHFGGWEHRDVHNIYGAFVHQATFEGLLEARQNTERPFVLSRAFFAGSQRFGAVWTGDNAANWEHLRSTVPMLLSLQVSQIIFSGADVGGFFGNPEPELLVRWYQAAAFQPFFRGHAHLDTARREPWLFGEENTALISAAIRTRYEYLPFWYTLFADSAVATDGAECAPPMRPLWWHFANDQTVEDVEDEWMIGDSLLVAPVLYPKIKTREVKLPEADWFDIYGGGHRVDGGTTSISVTMSRMIVFQRAGTIVPKQERRRRSSKSMRRDPITLVVALDSAGSATGRLFHDDGTSFDFRSGEPGRGLFTSRVFQFENRKLTASKPLGSGTEDVQVERIVVMGLEADPAEVQTEDGRRLSWSRIQRSLVVKSPGVSATLGAWSIVF